MHILITMIVGLIIGALAKLVMPGRDPGGILVTMLIGIGGAFIAGVVGNALGWYGMGQGPGIIASVIGSVALLAMYRLIAHPRRSW